MEDELLPLLQAYGSLCPVRNLQWPRNLAPTAIQEFLLDDLLFNPHFSSYPPDTSHQRSFWKWAIDNLERREEEVDEKIYEHYLHLLENAKSNSKEPFERTAPSPSFRTYIWQKREDTTKRPDISSSSQNEKSQDWITLLESGTTIEMGTTGLRTWSASFALAEYLAKHSELLDARVLEIGSGAGFLGIIMARLQMRQFDSSQASPSERQASISLTLSDVDHNVLRRCQANLALPCNNLERHPNLSCRLLDWCDALDTALKDETEQFLSDVNPDVIVGADLVYDLDIIPALVATLGLAINTHVRSDRRAYIALTVRNEETLNAFRRAAGKILEIKEEVLNERSFLVSNESLEGIHGWPVRLFLLTRKS